MRVTEGEVHYRAALEVAVSALVVVAQLAVDEVELLVAVGSGPTCNV